MDLKLSETERGRLRELAKRQAEIAALPVMRRREALWYDLNDGKTTQPLVTMEFHGLEHEVYPVITCADPFFNAVERQLTYNIFKHEHYKDDRVIPAFVKIHIPNGIIPFGARVEIERARDSNGAAGMGYMFKHIIKDLNDDFDKIKKSEFTVDAGLKNANALKETVEDILGDILPVKLEFPSFGFSPAHVFVTMMGMETMFCSILDYPDLFHRAVRRLTDDYHAYIDALEAGGAIIPNNDAGSVGQDTYGYTRDLPDLGELDRPVKLSDVWGYANFQETVGMSVPMFDEFFFSYMKEITDRCGLLSYGCCEPVDVLWEPCLSRLKNLRKLSVSPWNDEEALGEMIRGTKIVYHRKPSPNYISVDAVFDEEAFAKHMEKTVKAARGCPLEVTFRDITSVRGEPWRLTRAVELTREAFARCWKP